MIAVLPVLLLLALMFLGLPVALSLGAAGVFGIWAVTGSWSTVMGIVQSAPYRIAADYILITVPMFILMAYFTSSSGIARDLYGAAAAWWSPVRGGLAIASVFSCAIFGAMSGASVAAAAVMSNIAIPNMRRFGYSKVLAAGAVGVGATLDILIPPSVAMVIYGIATETSIGELLIAGIVPGIVVAAFLVALIWLWILVDPSLAPPPRPVPWPERWSSLRGTWPSLLVILLVIGLLYTGVATPSELGALGSLAAGVVAVLMGRLGWRAAVKAMQMTVRSTAMLFAILIGAKVFSYYLTLSGVPQRLVGLVSEANVNRWVVIAGICVGYFIISMFMDEIPLLLITLQVSFPLVKSLGFDPVWFGVVSMLLVSLGLVFPPVGMVAFVVSSVSGVELMTVYRGTSVLMFAIVMTLILIMFFPQIVLFLPATMR